MSELYRYQRDAIRFLIRNGGRGLLAMEPGTGKTRTALYAAMGPLDTTNGVIVAPLNALGVWEDEAAEIRLGGAVRVAPRVKRADLPGELFARRPPFWALNYEQLAYRTKDYRYPVVEALSGLDTLIVDESHYIKSSSAIRTKAVERLAKHAKNVILLTGTPITKNLLDLYTQLKIVHPPIWDRGGKTPSFTNWKRRVGVFGGFEGRELVGYKDPDRDILTPAGPWTYVVRKEDALDLPETMDQMVPVRIPSNVMNRIREKVKLEDHQLTRLLRWQMALGAEKVPVTTELVKDLVDSGKQVVIFHRFRDEAAQIKNSLSRFFQVPQINGDTSPERRQQLAREFREGKWPAMTVNIQAGSTALNLQSATEVVFHTLTWDHAQHVQARDRVHRIGQAGKVTYRYVMARGPQGGNLIDDVILQALREKNDVASALMAQERNW